MLNVEDFRLSEDAKEKLVFRRAPKRKLSKGRKRLNYLGAGIPLEWLSVAGNLQGKTLHVGLAIWLAHGIEKKDRFRFTPRWYAWFDISSGAVRRALHRLKDAKLIRLEYRPGCSPIVTLLPVPEECET